MDDFGAEHIAQIVAKYPRLFSAGRRPHQSSLPHGWAPIVDDLVGSIDALLDDDRATRFFIFRIGEKAGRLRLDTNLFSRDADGNLQPLEPLPAADAAVEREILRLIETAGQRSAETCRECGVPSSIRSVDGHVSTLCDTCQAQRLAELEKAAQFDEITRLVLHHPRLFHGQSPVVASWLNPGWEPIVETLFDAIDKLIDDDQSARFQVRQVKEKFGGLRVYVSLQSVADQDDDDDEPSPPLSPADEAASLEISKLIRQAERDAASTCEGCGKPSGIRTIQGCMTTLCDACLAQKNITP